jgi:hypothetical protein
MQQGAMMTERCECLLCLVLVANMADLNIDARLARLVFASRMPPAFLRRATLVASVWGVRPLKISDPRWVGTCAVSIESFAVNGTP